MTANRTRSARLAKVVHAASLGVLALAAVGATLGAIADSGGEQPDAFFGVMIVVVVAGYSTLGRLIVTRAGNVIGWIFLGIGAAAALGLPAEAYLQTAFNEPYEPSLPGTAYAGWLSNLTPALVALGIPMLFLLFPTGSPPGRRWRLVGWVWLVGAGLSIAWLAFRPGEIYGEPNRFSIDNPFSLGFIERAAGLFLNVGVVLVLIAAFASIVSLILRFRRARGEERQQIKWLMLVAIAAVSLFVAIGLVGAPEGDDGVDDALWMLLVAVLILGIPSATALAIFRYRLYDVDVVISKTIVYAGLALFIGAAYVAIVVGVGALIGGEGSDTSLRILATAAVALVFQPARDRLQAFANRLVYGKRASPYEVMAEFGHRIAQAPIVDEALPQMAEAAARGVGASAGRVTVYLGGDGDRSVVWPADADADEPTLALPITHAGEPVGELAVRKPANEPLRPAERSLLEDLARNAGSALHNVRLTAELTTKADELVRHTQDIRASQQRLVTARDTQRRRLERELRSGVGAELAGIRDELDGDAARVIVDPRSVRGSLVALGERANRALEELRDVARGIFPPVLADQGIAAALEAHTRKTGIDPPAMDATARGSRFEPAAENAVYFCCIQAVQNALRHAPGSRVRIGVAVESRALVFVVRDDGPGFDPASADEGEGIRIMHDRMAAQGGELTIVSAPGSGTTVSGRIPARALEATPS